MCSLWGARRKIHIMKAKYRLLLDVRDSPRGMGNSSNGTSATFLAAVPHLHSNTNAPVLHRPISMLSPIGSDGNSPLPTSSPYSSNSTISSAGSSPSPSPSPPVTSLFAPANSGGGGQLAFTGQSSSTSHSSGSISSQDRSTTVAAVVGAAIPSAGSVSTSTYDATINGGGSGGTTGNTASSGSGMSGSTQSASSQANGSRGKTKTASATSSGKASHHTVSGTSGGVAVANGIASAVRKRGINAQIDTQSMLDAAQAISQEMQLERALMALMSILLSCAGAESGLLISRRTGHRWVVEAKATPNGCQVMTPSSQADEYDTPSYLSSSISTPGGAGSRHGSMSSVSPVLPLSSSTVAPTAAVAGKAFGVVPKRSRTRVNFERPNINGAALSPGGTTFISSPLPSTQVTAPSSSSSSALATTTIGTGTATTPMVMSSHSIASSSSTSDVSTTSALSSLPSISGTDDNNNDNNNERNRNNTPSGREASPAFMYRLAALGSGSSAAMATTNTGSGASHGGISPNPPPHQNIHPPTHPPPLPHAHAHAVRGQSAPPIGLTTTLTGFSYRPSSQGLASSATSPTPSSGLLSATTLSPATSLTGASTPTMVTGMSPSFSSVLVSPTSSYPSLLSPVAPLGTRAETARAHLAALSGASSSIITPSSPQVGSGGGVGATVLTLRRSSRSRTPSSSSIPPPSAISSSGVGVGADIPPPNLAPITIVEDDDKTDIPIVPSGIDPIISSLWMQLPLTLFNFVLHTGKSPILNDASTDRQFSNDPYVQHFKPKSIMIVPFHLRNEIVSVLYLENNLVILQPLAPSQIDWTLISVDMIIDKGSIHS
jgi:hypothetical protein